MTSIEKINLLTSPEFMGALLAAIVIAAGAISVAIIRLCDLHDYKRVNAISEKYAKARAADIAKHRAFMSDIDKKFCASEARWKVAKERTAAGF